MVEKTVGELGWGGRWGFLLWDSLNGRWGEVEWMSGGVRGTWVPGEDPPYHIPEARSTSEQV